MFTIIWRHHALNGLAYAYTHLPLNEQRVLARAVEAFNTRLSNDPLSVGESRVDGVRVAFVHSLTIYYSVDVELEIVRVLSLSNPRAGSDG